MAIFTAGTCSEHIHRPRIPQLLSRMQCETNILCHAHTDVDEEYSDIEGRFRRWSLQREHI